MGPWQRGLEHVHLICAHEHGKGKVEVSYLARGEVFKGAKLTFSRATEGMAVRGLDSGHIVANAQLLPVDQVPQLVAPPLDGQSEPASKRQIQALIHDRCGTQALCVRLDFV